jgi:Zn-dependent alcohol dehydrogenase
VRQLTGGWGADYAFEVIGDASTVRQAYDSVRKGGAAVVVGAAPEDAEVAISPIDMMRTGRRILGCTYGSIRPHFDIPRYVELYLGGRIKLDELISRRFALDEINQAFAALEAGEVARGVVVFD